MPNLIFEYAANKAHAIEVMERILEAIDHLQIPRVRDSDLPKAEELIETSGSDLNFRWRVPLPTRITKDRLKALAVALPNGVYVHSD